MSVLTNYHYVSYLRWYLMSKAGNMLLIMSLVSERRGEEGETFKILLVLYSMCLPSEFAAFSLIP